MGVQINGDTGNISATKADYSGNVTIGGTLTYEDVTNIDSVGLITAREGIEVGARPGVAASVSVDGNAVFSGIVTASSFIGSGSGLTGVASTDNIRTNTNATFLQNVNVSGSTTTGSVKLANSDTALNQHSVGIGTTTNAGKLAGVGTAAGTMVYNTTNSRLEFFNGTSWSFLKSMATSFNIRYIVVGGGGAGGGNFRGGGGGAGALRTNWNSESQGGGTSSAAAKTVDIGSALSVIIGAGGQGQASTYGNDCGTTTFDDIVSKGGGGGGR